MPQTTELEVSADHLLRMSLGNWISGGDLVVNLLGLLLDRAKRQLQPRAPTGAPIYVVHSHCIIHNHYEAEGLSPESSPATATTNGMAPPEQLSLWE